VHRSVKKFLLILIFTQVNHSFAAAQSETHHLPIKMTIYIDHPQTTMPGEDSQADSTPGPPSLDNDDVGTPGPKGWQMDLGTGCDKARGNKACEIGFDAVYGIGERIQVGISKSIDSNELAGLPTETGFGATEIGAKWRFLDKNGFQIGVYPAFRFDDATRQKNSDGTLAESDGRSIYLPLLASWHPAGSQFTVGSNLGYRTNLDDATKNSVFTSVALGRSLGPVSVAMMEIESEATSQSRRTDVRVGYVRILFPHQMSKFQKSLFTSLGKSLGRTDDGKSHWTFLIGLSVANQTN